MSATYFYELPGSNPAPPARNVSYTLDKAGNRTGNAGVYDSASGSFTFIPNALNQYNPGASLPVTNGAVHEVANFDSENTLQGTFAEHMQQQQPAGVSEPGRTYGEGPAAAKGDRLTGKIRVIEILSN